MDKKCLKCWITFPTPNEKRKYCSLKCAYADRVKHKEKRCEVCWKLFKPQKESSKFCSQECFNSIHRSTRLGNILCLNCNKEFHPKDRWKKFCSLSCAYEYKILPREKWICPLCWKIFIKNPPDKKFCCKKCASQSQIKNWIIKCPICWKEFKARNAQTIYCSRECTYKSFTTEEYKERLKQFAFQRLEEKWYMREVQSEEMRSKYRIISKPNLDYKLFLEHEWYDVQLEFPLYWYSFDLKVWNTLIEINPTPFHNSTWHPLNKPKDKKYHYNKCKCAVENWYKCIMVWDWTSKNEVLELIEKDFEYKWQPNLHWYNIKTKEHILDEWFDKDDMITSGFVEVYDCWNLCYLTK